MIEINSDKNNISAGPGIVRQFVLSLIISGAIILAYEIAASWKPAEIAIWLYNSIIVLSISIFVTLLNMAIHLKQRSFRKKIIELNEQIIREGEKTAKTLLNASGSTNILINASDYKILHINRAGSLLFETTPEEIMGRTATKLFSHISELFPEKLKESVKEAKNVRFQNVSNGKYFYNQIYPIKTESGKVTKLAVFIQDITELHQIKELKMLNEELSELNATKDRMFSVIAHDLRSPVSGILNLSKLLKKNYGKYDPAKSELFLKSISDTSENVLALLDNLLAWAKSRRGQFDFNPVTVNLNKVIPEIIDILISHAENKNIQIQNNISGDIFCHADVNMLNSILRNLIQNSIKFTNPGGFISIDANIIENGTEISVRDTGIGISEESRLRLFSESSNISTGGTNNEKGSGLGLVLCREFVEKHSGRIWVESEEGNGSKFTFLLPAGHQ